MRALLPICIVSFLGVAAASAAGCSATLSIPTGGTLPGGGAIVFGTTPCSADVWFVDGSGWADCVGGVWTYVTVQPTTGTECTSAATCGGSSSGGDGGPGSTGDGPSSAGDTGTSSGDSSTSAGDSSTSAGDTGTSSGDGSGSTSTGGDGSGGTSTGGG